MRAFPLAALLLLLPLAAAHANSADPAACPRGIAPDTARRLFDVLNHPSAERDCTFEGLGTDRSRIEAHWRRTGLPLPPLTAAPAACAPGVVQRAGAFAVEVPAALTEACPSIAPRIAAFLAVLAAERPGSALGSEHEALFRSARALFVSIAALGVFLLARGVRRWTGANAGWVVLGAAALLAAAGVRAAIPFSLGNWYAEVLPAAGPPPWMRFGPGYFALQSLLRDLGLWGPRALAASQILLGALAVPLLLGVLRELRVSLSAAAATAVLLVVAPFHTRLSATPSEHVLASTLCLALLLAWLVAARNGDGVWLALAVLLFAAVCSTRVDMAVPAVAVLLWPLARDRNERNGGLRGAALWWRAALLGAAAAIVLLLTYRLIALPSHHPLPEAPGRALAARQFLWQFWVLATTDPRWMPLPAAVLALGGAADMAVRRPLLLARVLLTLLASFVVLGRLLTTDEVLGARYFLFAIAVFLIAPGIGFAAVVSWVPLRWRTVVTAAGLTGLTVWSVLDARPVFGLRYAFEDEYAFLRRALPKLPAGCRVYAIELRSAGFPRDLDCCLDVARSPLPLEFPHLQFGTVPDPAESVFDGSECLAYYESIACAIADDPLDPRVHERAAGAANDLRHRCNEVRALGQLLPLAETTTSPHATVNFFREARPRAGLYRWSH